MFRDFELTFTEEVSNFVKQEYKKASNILEYGSGGSTILGASQGKVVVSTESSAPWLVELMGAYKEKKLPGDIIPIYCADLNLKCITQKAWHRKAYQLESEVIQKQQANQ